MECTKWRRSLQEVCLQENPTEEIIVGKEYMKKKNDMSLLETILLI